MIRSSPSRSATLALHPSSPRARDTSSQLRLTSPGRSGQKLWRRQLEAARGADVTQRLDQIKHRGLFAAGDVDRARDLGVGSEEVGADDVGHVDPIARLAAVAEHLGRAAVQQATAEDRDDTRLTVDVLARPVDVAVAERHGREAEQPRVQLAIALGGVLALPVRRERTDREILGGGQQRGVAVQPAAGRGIDNPVDAAFSRGGEHVDRAQYVDQSVGGRVGDGVAHVDLGSQVEDELWPHVGEQIGHRIGVAYVELV